MKRVDLKKHSKILWITIAVILSVSIVLSSVLFSVYFVDSSVKPEVKESSKNVILMIGDGMGAEHIKAARLSDPSGGLLVMEKFQTQGEVVTRSLTPPCTDSAASATSYATGNKTYNGRLSYKDGKAMTTIAEKAMANDKKVGIVATKAVTDATPAAFLAHVKSRNMADKIAAQIVASDVDVLFGLNNAAMEDAIAAASSSANRAYCSTFDEISAAVNSNTEKVFGLLNDAIPTSGPQSLAYLTDQAIKKLTQNNDNGFFLMVEGSKIDSYSHAGDMENMIRELRAFNDAVGVARSWAERHGDTTVIVVADHETGKLKVPDGAKSEDVLNYENSNKWFHSGSHTNSDIKYFIYHSTTEAIYTEGVITSYREKKIANFPKRLDNTDIYRLIDQLLF